MTRIPLISCLMVTAGGAYRFPRFVRSVAAYCYQTHPHRELVIVADRMSDRDFAAIRGHCRSLGRTDIHLVRSRTRRNIGQLRNVSVDVCRGDVICLWDDDDVNHPMRLELQCDALRVAGSGAVYLRDIMHLLEPHQAIYWVDFDRLERRCASPTLMAFKRDLPRFPEVGPDSKANETVNVFMQLAAANHIAILGGLPHLFVYVFHGQNFSALKHHMSRLNHAASATQLSKHKRRLLSELARINLDWSGVQLMTYSGAWHHFGEKREVAKRVTT